MKINIDQLVHQAKVQKVKESKVKTAGASSAASAADEEILKRMDQSRLLLDRLRNTKPEPPAYANSLLQAAIHDKGRVLEALLSTVQDVDQRRFLLHERDEHNRNAVFYAAANGNVEALELLSAADASFNLTDT